MLFSLFRHAIVVLMMMKLSLNARPTQPDPDAAVAFGTWSWEVGTGSGVGVGIWSRDQGFGGVTRSSWHLACWSAGACTLVMKSNLRYIRLIVRILFVDSIPYEFGGGRLRRFHVIIAYKINERAFAWKI